VRQIALQRRAKRLTAGFYVTGQMKEFKPIQKLRQPQLQSNGVNVGRVHKDVFLAWQ
jgi:hypothetical protein